MFGLRPPAAQGLLWPGPREAEVMRVPGLRGCGGMRIHFLKILEAGRTAIFPPPDPPIEKEDIRLYMVYQDPAQPVRVINLHHPPPPPPEESVEPHPPPGKGGMGYG